MVCVLNLPFINEVTVASEGLEKGVNKAGELQVALRHFTS